MTADTRIEQLNRMMRNTLMETLDIRFTDIGEDFLVASMPVDARVHQPMGILHGGATAALAETVGSAASSLQVNPDTHAVVGIDLGIHHLRAVREGTLTARAEPVHLGRRTHLWSIPVHDDRERQIALAELTMMVVENGSLGA